MPTFRHRDATLYYEEFGQGFPILTFAPAGLQSPIDPTTELAAGFRGKRLPRSELVREWKTEPALTSARARVREFLAKHTPLG